ncbi:MULTISPECIES: hypothetical protein [Actinosynnema]|uniref:hypothetical protein n=1 Tax=Actinosynnema TaxID=40566 RepID=UPI0020A4F5E1|nr:hypothetical protein [Actinosynnema pretiosum]MCP2097383.1 hypothetical protein [Actinosynnema pretiosum]
MAKKSKSKRTPVRRPIPESKLTGGPRREKGGYHVGTLKSAGRAVQNLLVAPEVAPDLRVELLPPLLWLQHADGLPGNLCVGATMTLHHAYAQLGIVAEPLAVDLVVRNERTYQTTMYGRPDPYWEGRVFHGHAVLWMPRSGRLCDATVERYPEVRRYRLGPVVGRSVGYGTDTPEHRAAAERGELPAGSHIAVNRKDLLLMYTVVDDRYARVVADHAHDPELREDYRRGGVNLAAEALQLWRLPEIADRIRQAPYPRLHALLDAVGDARATVDEAGDVRFLLHTDGGELALRLDEIPLPRDLPDPATLPRLYDVAELPGPAEIDRHTDPVLVGEAAQDVRTEARTLITGDHTTGGGDEPVVVFEPLRAIGMRQGGLTTEMQAFAIIQAGFARAASGRLRPPHLAHWSVRLTGDGLELWDDGGLWAQAPHTPDPAWRAAAEQHGRVRVIYGVRTGVRVPTCLTPEDYTPQRRGEELLHSRGQGIVAVATVPWHAA